MAPIHPRVRRLAAYGSLFLAGTAISLFGFALHAAWNTTVNSGDILTNTLWNDVINRLAVLTNELDGKGRIDLSPAGASATFTCTGAAQAVSVPVAGHPQAGVKAGIYSFYKSGAAYNDSMIQLSGASVYGQVFGIGGTQNCGTFDIGAYGEAVVVPVNAAGQFVCTRTNGADVPVTATLIGYVY